MKKTKEFLYDMNEEACMRFMGAVLGTVLGVLKTGKVNPEIDACITIYLATAMDAGLIEPGNEEAPRTDHEILTEFLHALATPVTDVTDPTTLTEIPDDRYIH